MPAAMSRHEIDDLLRDVSTQMARSQLTRHSSGRSGHTSASLKSKVARVMKINSAGNSPRSIGRRKTTTSQSPARRQPTLDDHYDNMISRGHHSNAQSRPQQYRRPISWHPSSLAPGNPSSQPWGSETKGPRFPLQASRGNQTVALNGPSTSSLFPDPHVLSSTNPIRPIEATYMPHQLADFYSRDDSYPPLPGPAVYPYGPLSFSDPTSASALGSYRAVADMPHSSPKHPSQNWLGLCEGAAIAVTAPASPDFLPMQHPSFHSAERERTRLAKQSSGELVGVGLYDNPEDTSTLDKLGRPLPAFRRLQNLAFSRHQSAGKGLKLEETWQPPSEEDLDQADENSSSDGSEEELPQACAFPGTHQLPVPASSGLANHTFYFEGDDGYGGRMFYDETMSAIDSKTHGVVFDSLAWL